MIEHFENRKEFYMNVSFTYIGLGKFNIMLKITFEMLKMITILKKCKNTSITVFSKLEDELNMYGTLVHWEAELAVIIKRKNISIFLNFFCFTWGSMLLQ